MGWWRWATWRVCFEPTVDVPENCRRWSHSLQVDIATAVLQHATADESQLEVPCIFFFSNRDALQLGPQQGRGGGMSNLCGHPFLFWTTTNIFNLNLCHVVLHCAAKLQHTFRQLIRLARGCETCADLDSQSCSRYWLTEWVSSSPNSHIFAEFTIQIQMFFFFSSSLPSLHLEWKAQSKRMSGMPPVSISTAERVVGPYDM